MLCLKCGCEIVPDYKVMCIECGENFEINEEMMCPKCGKRYDGVLCQKCTMENAKGNYRNSEVLKRGVKAMMVTIVCIVIYGCIKMSREYEPVEEKNMNPLKNRLPKLILVK